ncbi:MAG: squalene/phytoene synthase family protein [Gammaproteobacteria bacterium]|nr:squalene/phytoene synthase family protein [Gammaproteobacteria bacterium]
MLARFSTLTDDEYQAHILQGVSRTFALTIPVLPEGLYRAVANAYLLCRIADTIEDDATLPFELKRHYSALFLRAVQSSAGPVHFGQELAPQLAAHNSADERDLIANADRVLRITHSLNPTQRNALERCVRVMLDGMVFYQGQETLEGVSDQRALDRYCYYVAGVVGEMLTELFCDYCQTLRTAADELMRLAVSFGQGLQMTNILKDIWDDRARGACWLPRDEFAHHGLRLSDLNPGNGGVEFAAVIQQLVGVTHGHLQNALRYTLKIPPEQAGIRKFCLWALGMAVLTLRKINTNPLFRSSTEVKISRRQVQLTIAATSLAATNNTALRALFYVSSRGLPRLDIVACGPTYIEGLEAQHSRS